MTTGFSFQFTTTRAFARALVGAAMVVGLLVINSCRHQTAQDRKAGERLRVLCTTGIIADAARFIGQDDIELNVLMGPGVDPHLYKASQADVSKLSRAHLIFYNGLHLEGKMGEILHKVGAYKPVVALSDGLPPAKLRFADGQTGVYDPHIWFDVMLWRQAIEHLGQSLAAHDSLNARKYKARTALYCQQLDSLDRWVHQQWGQIRPERRILITAHDAFGYYGRAYGVHVRGLQGISTQAEYGLQDVTSLVNYITQARLKAIFVETSVPQKAIEAVIAGCKSQGWQLSMGPALYSDALGEAGTAEGTYIGMVRANTTAVVSALK